MTPASLEWISKFRRFISTERTLSKHTDSNYARDLAALVGFCDKQGIEEWARLDSQHLRMFASHSHATGRLAPRSIQRRLSAVRTFLEFLIREKVLTNNPGRDVRAPKAPRHLPETLDADQMARLLELPPGDVLVTRDRAIMELFYSSGLRLAELAALNLNSLDSDQTVRVVGKGNKERVLPVGRKAIEALAHWLNTRAELAKPDEPALFVGRTGKRLGHRAIQLRVEYWARRQGLPMHMHPHLFRHSFASHLLESSGELRGVQELLGHADISSTQIYTHLDFQHLSRIYDATHPRARKKA